MKQPKPCPHCGEELTGSIVFLAKRSDSPMEWRHSNNPKCWNDSRLVTEDDLDIWNTRVDNFESLLDKMRENSVETPPEIREILNKKFWDII